MIPSVVLTPAVEHRRQLLISINCIHYKGCKAICQRFFEISFKKFQSFILPIFAAQIAAL